MITQILKLKTKDLNNKQPVIKIQLKQTLHTLNELSQNRNQLYWPATRSWTLFALCVLKKDVETTKTCVAYVQICMRNGTKYWNKYGVYNWQLLYLYTYRLETMKA